MGWQGRLVHGPIRVRRSVSTKRQASGSDPEGDIERQRTGTIDWLVVHKDRPLRTEGDEIPVPSPAVQATRFIVNVAIGQPYLARRRTANSDRDPGNLHDLNRRRFSILKV